MGEFSGIGANVQNNAVRPKHHMAPDAIFVLEPVKPRLPTLPVELPAKRRGNGDAPAFNDDEEPSIFLFKRNSDIPVITNRRQRVLANELQALD